MRLAANPRLGQGAHSLAPGRVGWGLWGALFLLALVAILAFQAIGTALQIFGAARRAQRVNLALEEANRAYSRAVGARRSFSVAGDDRQLGELPALDGVWQRATAALRAAVADLPEQSPRVEALEGLWRQRLANLDAEVATRRRTGQAQEEAADLELAARIRDLRERIQVEQDRLVDDQARSTEHELKRTQLFLVLGTAAGFGLLLLAFQRLRREIATRRQSERQLLLARNEVELANRELESFSYSVAHDLRAPLRAIDGFAQILLEDQGSALGQSGRADLTQVRDSAQQMALLIDGLLRLAQVSRSQLARGPVDLTLLARASEARWRQLVPGRAVEFVAQEDLLAEGDSSLLSSALDNLIGNAWKFSRGRSLAKIEVGATSRDGERVFFVRDNGAGFDPAHAAKLFRPFQRLHPRSEFEGSGIGLATVERIINRHGGRVWAEGRPHEGATFYFTLSSLRRQDSTS